ncbi:MAG: zinc metallopeptidase [Gammaproteobacteria bacterium]|nr:zinc metallopeptidase [Gammaproteobacteria bacterium]NVK88476.1 zinc metallopeptidase [Gammaproteobacteria bacterium]
MTALVIVLVLLLVLLLGPNWWVTRTLKRYSVDYPDLPGTGGQLARHLADRFELTVTIEETEQGDHYAPDDRAIRLTKEHFHGRSLSAVTVAAHEFGHALQHHQGYRPLLWRGRLARMAYFAEKLAAVAFVVAPILAIVSRSPVLTVAVLFIAVSNMLLSIVVHLVTLPVEWDASFKRALPILRDGGYLTTQEMPIAKKILTAAALTYVSSALMGLLNVGRWWAILRRPF